MAKNSLSQKALYSGHFTSLRKSSGEDLISTIQISPLSEIANMAARRPEDRVNSGSTGKIRSPQQARYATLYHQRRIRLPAVRNKLQAHECLLSRLPPSS